MLDMKEKIVIFGNSEFAQLAKYYFETDSPHKVVAFTTDEKYITGNSFEQLPLVAFEQVEEHYPPEYYTMFIAVGYSKMNKLRAHKFQQARTKGYQLTNYVSSACTYRSQYAPGANSFIFEDNTIQPFVKIYENVILWSGNHIGHHSIIKSHTFISSHVVVSGHCEVNSYCFLGVNATIADGVCIADETLVGAGAIITNDTMFRGVYLPSKTIKITKTSDQIKL